MNSDKFEPFLRLRSALMRAFFNLLYNQMAWGYDLVADIVSLGMWRDWVRAVIPYLNGPQVLELGHGPGHLQVALHEKTTEAPNSLQVIGLDKSKQMGQIAKRRLIRHGYQSTLINGDAQMLPLPDESVHQIVATFPSEYISSPHTLEEVKRVLKPGGKLVILALAWITGKRLHQRAAAKLFEITGQAPAWDDHFLEPARMKGFEALAERVDGKNSQMQIIIITKFVERA